MTRTSITEKIGRKETEWPISDVAFLQASDKYVTAKTIEGREIIISDTLQDLACEFSDLFIRSHRGVLVARRLVSGVKRISNTGVYGVLLDGVPAPVPLSRRCIPAIRAALSETCGA